MPSSFSPQVLLYKTVSPWVSYPNPSPPLSLPPAVPKTPSPPAPSKKPALPKIPESPPSCQSYGTQEQRGTGNGGAC
ncbi:hypothetical protein H2248_006984 [Termitomyces sp. 'cryptogamus']|nr:hypothetical protein H2248_006984 [Termitomyces sp. 'cryptogamus']